MSLSYPILKMTTTLGLQFLDVFQQTEIHGKNTKKQ